MEKYLEMMKSADEECGRIASRVKRYAQNLAEIDNGTIYAVAYRAVKKKNWKRLSPLKLSRCVRRLHKRSRPLWRKPWSL